MATKDPKEILDELVALQKQYGNEQVKIIKNQVEGDIFLKKFNYFLKMGIDYSTSDSNLIDEIKKLLKAHDRVLVIADFDSRIYRTYIPKGEQRQTAEAESGGCFVATATYGSSFAPEVEKFREFRDKVLLKSKSGRKFVKFYYHLSPPIAETIAPRDYMRTIVRVLFLAPMLRLIKVINRIFSSKHA